jgi:hypothetical protein
LNDFSFFSFFYFTPSGCGYHLNELLFKCGRECRWGFAFITDIGVDSLSGKNPRPPFFHLPEFLLSPAQNAAKESGPRGLLNIYGANSTHEDPISDEIAGYYCSNCFVFLFFP